MPSKPKNTAILLTAILLTSIITPVVLSENYNRTYNCNAQFGLNSHTIYVSVPQSLYEYYQTKTHIIRYENDYQNFVTPAAMATIAENIRNMTFTETYSDEEFANAVLTLVHEIPYVTSDVKYPVETIVDNQGDCDTVSLLAASILKAGGLDVVLFYYPKAAHMNIGIYLPNKPYSTWMTPPKSYEYNGTEYWMAECTPRAEWQVGDQPESLAGETPMIIPLDNCEKTAPTQVASTLDTPLTPSNITINLSSPPIPFYYEEQNLTVSGKITPAVPDANVVMYLSQNATAWDTYTTKTDQAGQYSFPWDFTKTGTYYIKTSWSGAGNYSGADSENLIVFIGFPKIQIQFQTREYSYILGNPAIAAQELSIRQGVKNFLNLNLTGAGVTLTGEFIVLKSGETLSNVREPEYRIGDQPLRLPDNLIKNDQFCLLLQRGNESNYNVNVKALDKDDVSQMQQLQGTKTAFLNASASVKENRWYKVTAKLSETEIIAELRDISGNILERMVNTNNGANIDEIGILIANNTDRAVAFKNLEVKALNEPIQPLDGNVVPTNELETVMPYINWAIVVASVFTAAVYILRRRKTVHALKS
ncbi:carboxypeptidase regulatory-like domain-containing protein [Candidatus Bathyarchaeota archaeon A05DMB-2]|jgi:hypothetical protein|nr:carboxypeptidase regulatory-like domain-containing protein [Candidatus Bathyarchaeota archaeon A05DMB-2]